jgi:transcriptional regulator with XRE-family HTH domain
MKQKSLRQSAKELGVSASYLSQVRHGKRPASDRLMNALNNPSVKQSVKQYGKILGDFVSGEVPELADGHDLGSCALWRGGSSPPFPTKRFWRISEVIELMKALILAGGRGARLEPLTKSPSSMIIKALVRRAI